MKVRNLTLVQQTVASLISWSISFVIVLVRFLFPDIPAVVGKPIQLFAILLLVVCIVIMLLKKEPYDERALHNDMKASQWTLFAVTTGVGIWIIIALIQNLHIQVDNQLLLGVLAIINILKNSLFIFFEKCGNKDA